MIGLQERVPDWSELPTRDKILMASREEFVERGFEGARVQRIAEVSGANKAMIYYYFGDKRQLYLKVLSAVFNVAIESLAGIAATDLPPREKMKLVVRFYVDFYGSNKDFLRLLMREFANRGSTLPDLLAEMGSMAQQHGFPHGLYSMLQQGIESNEFRPLDPRHTMISLISMCAGYFMLQPAADMFLSLVGDIDHKEFVEGRADQVMELLFHGISAESKR